MMGRVMQPAQKKRLLQLLRFIVMILLIGVLYYVFSALTGLRIPCIFYETTGWYCPGCGLTRFCTALMHLDIRSAAEANLLFVVLLPFLLCTGICKAMQYIRKGSCPVGTGERCFWLLCLAAALLFGILRNLPMFSYLQPK